MLNENSTSQKLVAKRRKFCEIDYYPTPIMVTESLMKREKFSGLVYECACGEGHMAEVIKKHNPVLASDIKNYGYGLVKDFFSTTGSFDNIITNPPFSSAERFVVHAKKLTKKKIAIFHRLLFLESVRRYSLFNDVDFPLSKVYVFSKRVNLFENGQSKKVSGTVAFAWFVWNKDHIGKPLIEWII